MKYTITIYFTYFFLFFKKMTVRKFKMAYVASIEFLVGSTVLDGAAHPSFKRTQRRRE